MRIVEDPAELPAALISARREATSSFGDDTLFLERFVLRPRHIEVQILADTHGNVIHLGERECSLQRRHQKAREEVPSPLLDAATRARIGEAACNTAYRTLVDALSVMGLAWRRPPRLHRLPVNVARALGGWPHAAHWTRSSACGDHRPLNLPAPG